MKTIIITIVTMPFFVFVYHWALIKELSYLFPDHEPGGLTHFFVGCLILSTCLVGSLYLDECEKEKK